MHREGSNILRCKPFFGVQLLKQGLHLEIFDPSQCMIEPGKAGSKLVAVVGDGGGDDDHLLFGIGQNEVEIESQLMKSNFWGRFFSLDPTLLFHSLKVVHIMYNF